MSLLSNDEINLLNSDSKYRNYVSSIEKALKNFESSTEWADLISSLNKLKKVLISTPKYQFIPKRVSVCKRLAQCLHPALPSGVHLKALEVYTVLFQNIGPDNLSKDLFIYSSGLFPLLANAALSVKPVLINIYEQYFLPLKKALRPCLTGLILGILPGLEEGSDFYSRTFNLLKNICIAQSDCQITKTNGSRDSFESTSSIQIADEKYFYTCLWSAIVSQSSVRFPAIQFILANYETKKKSNLTQPMQSPDEDQLYLIGNSIDLMVNGICCCLQDPNPLVQRSILDFICLCLPINTTQITKNDKLQLIVVAIHVVLRRDMSLNRRIYTWLMGPTSAKPKTNDSTQNESLSKNYFDLYSKSLLISSIKMLLNNKKEPTILYLFNEEQQNQTQLSSQVTNQNALLVSNANTLLLNALNTNNTLRILKIVSNLVERQDIGQSIIDEILLDLLFYVYKESCSLNNIYSQSNYGNYSQPNGHKRTQSNLIVTNTITTSNQFKELNELKKATYNFLFESFQRYFIWDFCANKFELICKNYTEMTSNTLVNTTPGQLCDLYEFILDLLKTNEMYAEIQSEYLPLMLKRIIKTLNNYCSKMSNLDLSKSILLCSKILKKVVPEIVIADQHKPTQQHQRNRSEVKHYHVTTKPVEPIRTIDENKDEDELVINDILYDLISQIESQSDEVKPLAVEPTTQQKSENNDFIIESCVFYLKQLCHTFIKSHLIQTNDLNFIHDNIKKSFQSLFNQNNSNKNMNFIDLNCDICLNNEPQEDYTQIQLINLKTECSNYLQSFQILNKFLIKMLFFPREKEQQEDENSKKNKRADDEQEDLNECCRLARKEKINKLIIDSFDEWVKDLFVISCCSTLNNQKTSYSSKLFEFQSITINAIIELIHLSESVNAHFPSSKTSSRTNSIDLNWTNNETANKISKNTCLIQTVFTSKQIDLIYNQSDFGLIIAKMLWSHLSNDSFLNNYNLNNQLNSNSNFSQQFSKLESTTDKRASILFCLLHETLPNNLCEDIIAQNLVQNSMPFTTSANNPKSKFADSLINDSLIRQLDSLKRFIRLWHWSREINSINQTNDDLDDLSDFMNDFINLKTTLTFKRSTKTFERSLLIILDMLNDKSTAAAIIKLIQDWLITLICDYNDLPRLLDILLVSLLQPSTARVSVQHFITNLITNSFQTTILPVNSTNDSTEPEPDYESKVYAISNEGGNVKYHVNELTNTKKATNQQQQFLLTSLNLNQSSSSLPSLTNGSSLNNSLNTNGSTSKLVKNPNVELPLSVLNASTLDKGISLRINPNEFINSKQTDKDDNLESTSDDYDHVDSHENTKILEKYKAMKANQFKDKDRLNVSISTSNSNASSPSHSNKNFMPKLEPETQDLNSFCNEEEDENIVTNDENEPFEDEDYYNHDEDDEEDDEEEDEESAYNSQCGFHLNSDDNFYDDNQSQSTDITLLKDEHDLIPTIQTSNPEKAKLDDKKHKRKSDLILSVNKISTQTSNDSQKKSLSLTGRYKSKNKTKEISPKSKLVTNNLNNSQITLKEKSATIGASRHPIKSNNSPCRLLTNSLKKTIVNKELTVDALNPIDQNYSYLLIYSNCNNMQASHNISTNKLTISSASNSSYDHTRTLFILRCLDQLLNKCPKEFLTSVTRTFITSNTNLNNKTSTNQPNGLNNQSGFSVHNEKLLDLIIRHLKSIYGNSFYSDTSLTNSFDLNKLNFNLSNVTYIESITIILLFYIRSYYPPSEFGLINEKIQVASKTLLSSSISSSSLNTSSNESSLLSQCSSNSESLKSANTSTLSQSSPHLLINQPVNTESEDRLDNDEKLFNENRNVQIYCLQILSKMIKELSSLCRFSNSMSSASFQRSSSQINFCNGFLLSASNPSSFQPIIDLLDKCKLQKTLLHCFYSTIQTPTQDTLAQCILTNSKYIKETNIRDEILNSRKHIQYAYMSELMDSLENLIQLEKILNDYQTITKINRSASNTTTSINGTTTRTESNEDDFLLTFIKRANNSLPNAVNKPISITNNSIPLNSSTNSLRYISIQSICNQSMFISSVLYYLKSISLVDYHLPILKLVRNSLPSAGNALKPLSTFVIEQLCRNLLQITNCNVSNGSSTSSSSYLIPAIAYMSSISSTINIPDLIVSILKQLSYLLHYCLLSTSNVFNNDLNSNSLMNQFMISMLQSSNISDTQLKMFKQYQTENETYLSQAKESLINLLPSIMSSMTQVWQRCNLLFNSNGLNGVNILFEPISQHQQQHQHQYSWILGHPIIIKQAITDMLSPVVQYNGTAFMAAIGFVWGEKRKRSKLNQEHKVIIEIMKSLKICTLPVILQSIIEILKQSNINNKDKKKSLLNVWLLQFLHSYLDSYSQSIKKNSPDTLDTLAPTINALCNFFKECLSSSVTSNLIPACYFQLFRILHDSVNNFPELVDDKKYTKEIQDSTHKLFEVCNSIVASSLQQTTWLRKNYAVKLVPEPIAQQQIKPQASVVANFTNSQNSLASLPSQSTTSTYTASNVNNSTLLLNQSLASTDITQSTNSIMDSNSSGYAGSNTMLSSTSNVSDSKFRQNKDGRIASLSDLENDIGPNNSDASSNLNSIDHLNSNGDLNDSNNLNHSLQALNILAEYLAKTLDIVYKSDEKDRLVVPLLTSLMFNLWPYLKTHSIANKNNFRAASHLLMSLTIYPYTRKTWRKEVFEMLFDNLYFHVDSPTLDDCKIIIDNLISNDRQMFKDVLVRVQYQQSSGLFTSKEQESEQKAQLLKRLAFVIYSSEKDQYQKNMPDIQECIAHILKLVQSPNLYSTLFLLFRILLLRISGRHLIALWPTFLTELIIILLQLEQDLSDDIDSKNISKTSYLDHIANTNSTLQQSNPIKLQIYLSACKLIDLILTLPSSVTAQFQMCKWSFINTVDVLDLKQRDQFVPYLIKINNLLKIKFPNSKAPVYRVTGGPLIRQRQIQSIVDLKPFFEIVNTHSFVHNSNQTQLGQQNSPQQQSNYFKQFETSVHEDFLEGWQQ